MRQEQGWNGQCQFHTIGTPCSLSREARRAAFHIVHEAVTNAIKHPDATIIHVQLQYPDTSDDQVCLTIGDNGQNAQMVAAREGHRGVPYMLDSARAAGGKVRFEATRGQGTTVIFRFPSEASLRATVIEHPYDGIR